MQIQNNKGIGGADQPITPPPTTPPLDPSLASSLFVDCPAQPDVQQADEPCKELIQGLIDADQDALLRQQQDILNALDEALRNNVESDQEAITHPQTTDVPNPTTPPQAPTLPPDPPTPQEPVPTCPPAPEASAQHGLESGSALGPKPERI